MMIRLANIEQDKEQLIQGLHSFVQRINKPELFPGEKIDREQAFINLLSNPFCSTIVEDIDGKLLGGVGVIVTPYIWNPTIVSSEEIFLWCYPDAPKTTVLKLIRSAKQLAKDKGAEFMALSKMYNSPEGLHKVYLMLGAQELQTTYVLRL